MLQQKNLITQCGSGKYLAIIITTGYMYSYIVETGKK